MNTVKTTRHAHGLFRGPPGKIEEVLRKRKRGLSTATLFTASFIHLETSRRETHHNHPRQGKTSRRPYLEEATPLQEIAGQICSTCLDIELSAGFAYC